MGMFDDIVYEAPCPICGTPLKGWQSKDAGCCLEKLTPAQLWQQSECTRTGGSRNHGYESRDYTEVPNHNRPVPASFWACCDGASYGPFDTRAEADEVRAKWGVRSWTEVNAGE